MENQLTLQLALDAVKHDFTLCSAEARALVEEIDRLRHEKAVSLAARAQRQKLYDAVLADNEELRHDCERLYASLTAEMNAREAAPYDSATEKQP